MKRMDVIRSALRGSPAAPPDFEWIEEEGMAALVQKLNARKPFAEALRIV
jgi:hypothetical protein